MDDCFRSSFLERSYKNKKIQKAVLTLGIGSIILCL